MFKHSLNFVRRYKKSKLTNLICIFKNPTMQRSLKISTLKLLLVNLIPVIGVIFFEWELFETAITYILETICVFLVFDIDQYFIDKDTRIPLPFALLQFIFTIATFLALMAGSALMIFSIITPPMETSYGFTQLFTYR